MRGDDPDEFWYRNYPRIWPEYEHRTEVTDETVVMQQVAQYEQPIRAAQLTEALRQVKALKRELDSMVQTEQKYSDRTLMALAGSLVCVVFNVCLLISMVFLGS